MARESMTWTDKVESVNAVATAAPTIDELVAAEVLGAVFNPHFHQFSRDDEAAADLVQWLAERHIHCALAGNTVTFSRGRKRLFAQSADTPREALLKGALKLAREYPHLLGWRSDAD